MRKTGKVNMNPGLRLVLKIKAISRSAVHLIEMGCELALSRLVPLATDKKHSLCPKVLCS